jgi:class 3 adenylate cyclase
MHCWRNGSVVPCGRRRRYSRLAGGDKDHTLLLVAALRRDLIDPSVAVHHGRIVKPAGDGSIIEFRCVVDAMRCAMPTIQAAIAAAAPTRELLLRDANRRGERPPPLNVARLTAIAPDACRLTAATEG